MFLPPMKIIFRMAPMFKIYEMLYFGQLFWLLLSFLGIPDLTLWGAKMVYSADISTRNASLRGAYSQTSGMIQRDSLPNYKLSPEREKQYENLIIFGLIKKRTLSQMTI